MYISEYNFSSALDIIRYILYIQKYVLKIYLIHFALPHLNRIFQTFYSWGIFRNTLRSFFLFISTMTIRYITENSPLF